MEEQQHICQYCAQGIQADQPKIELLCHHRAHSECFLTRLGNLDQTIRRCQVCTYFNFPPESHLEGILQQMNDEVVEDDDDTVTEETDNTQPVQAPLYIPKEERIETLYTTDPTLKTDLKNYMKIRREFFSRQRLLKGFIKDYKQGLRQKVQPIHEELKVIEREYKSAIHSSEQYKAYTRRRTAMIFAKTRIEQKYGWGMRDLRRVLHTKPGLKRWKRDRYFDTSTYFIRRGFRFYLRY